MPHISVVAPVYNQTTETLLVLTQRLSASISPITEDFEIILIDDGSLNDAWAKIRDIATHNRHVKGLRLARNFGQHVAITVGLDHANGDWVVVMDADLQDRPEVIPELYAKAQEGFDVVFVNRVRRFEPIVYRTIAAAFYLVLNILSGEKYNRRQTNFSIVSTNAVRAFRSVRDPTRFYGGILRWVGFKHGSISAQPGARPAGTSSYSMIRRARFAFDLIVGFSTRLLYISVAFGLLMAIASFVMAGFIVAEKLLNPDYPLPGWPSVMTAVVFTAGVTNVAIGLLGIYIAKILEQTKDRPLYIVADATSPVQTTAER
jgi:glycosyltransferase involved in cell wall biosynthesis